MAVNSNTAFNFANSFMRGFSFVDDINSRKRKEKMLADRLEEEAKDRAAAREDRRVRRERETTIFNQNQEDRERIQNERELGREGDRVALRGNATQEELAPFINFSQAARDKYAALVGEDQLLRDLETVRSTSARPTQTGGLSAQVASGNPGEVEPGQTAESLLAPSRGRDAFQSVDLDDLQDPDAPRGLGGQILENLEGAGNRVTGTLRGLSVGAANAVNQALGDSPVESGADFGSALGGNISVPGEYTTEEEFTQINDPAEFEAARRRNDDIIADIKRRGDTGEENLSRLDLLRNGDREMRAEARQEEFRTEQRYVDYSDPDQNSQFRSLAAEDPHAASIQYFSDRATLQSANPQLAAAMDQQLQPVLQAAEVQLQDTIAGSPQATPDRARAVRDLRNLQATQGQIYSDYSPSQAAGIRDTGLPIGNAELAGNVADLAVDPNRPRPSVPMPGAQVRAAATTTSRMSGNRRATEAQLRAAIRLVDAGLATRADLLTLNMTGSWPDSSGAAQIKSGKPGDVIYTIDQNGNYNYVTTLPGGSGRGAGGRDGVGTNPLTQENLDQFRRGVRTMFPGDEDGTLEFQQAMEGQLLDDADWIQENFDLTDPIAANRIGRTYAAALKMQHAEDNFLPSWLGDFQPTARDILRSPALAAQLSVEHDIPFQLPPDQRYDGVDINNLRQELQIEGKYHPALQNAAENMSDEEFLFTVARYDFLTSQED